MYETQPGMDARTQAASQYQGGSNQNIAMKSPSVIEQLNIQEKTIMNAHGIFDQLVDRLAPILGPVPAVLGKDSAPAQPTPNQLSQRIPIHTRGVEVLGQRIQELIARIEL